MSFANRKKCMTLTVCCLLTSLLRDISCVIFGILLYCSFNKVPAQGSLCHFGDKGYNNNTQRPDTCEGKENSAPDFLLAEEWREKSRRASSPTSATQRVGYSHD